MEPPATDIYNWPMNNKTRQKSHKPQKELSSLPTLVLLIIYLLVICVLSVETPLPEVIPHRFEEGDILFG